MPSLVRVCGIPRSPAGSGVVVEDGGEVVRVFGSPVYRSRLFCCLDAQFGRFGLLKMDSALRAVS